jgi:hypothetical protein
VPCSAVSNLVGVSERAQESVFLGAGEGPRGSAACSSAERVREREGVDLGAGERAGRDYSVLFGGDGARRGRGGDLIGGECPARVGGELVSEKGARASVR